MNTFSTFQTTNRGRILAAPVFKNDNMKRVKITIRAFRVSKHKNGFSLGFNRKYNGTKWYHSKSISFGNYYGLWEVSRVFYFSDNGAKKLRKEDKCYDCTLTIGKLVFGYTNWDF